MVRSAGGKTAVWANPIIRHALVVGGVAFVLGFVGPIFLVPKSNLGPLFGVFFSGPMGVLAGALWGVLKSARSADAAETTSLSVWLLCLWVMSVMYTFVMIAMAPMLAIPAVALQAVFSGATLFFIFNPGTNSRLTTGVRRSMFVLLALMAVILISSSFPPVMHPAIASPSVRASPAPAFAFVLDGRFDSSRHVPLFAVRSSTLLLEWLVSGAAALGLVRLMKRRTDPA